MSYDEPAGPAHSDYEVMQFRVLAMKNTLWRRKEQVEERGEMLAKYKVQKAALEEKLREAKNYFRRPT